MACLPFRSSRTALAPDLVRRSACCSGAGTGTCGTCPTAGDLEAWNPVGSVAKPTCTIMLVDTASTCNTGAGKEVGTYELVGADHTMISGTATGTGVTFALTCE